MIHFDNICKRYPGGHDALNRINLRLPKGQMAFLTGHSGAGKSTLLKLIAMIERPTRGQLFLDGVNLNSISNRKIPYIRRNIGIIFQNHHLLYDRPVFDNVALPLVIQGYRRQEIRKRVRAALNQVGLLSKENQTQLLFLAASNNVLESHAPLFISHYCYLLTNPPVTSTLNYH